MIDRFLNAVVRRLNVRSVAGAGIVLGVAAFLLTLPPFTLRTTLVPIIFGLGALALHGVALVLDSTVEVTPLALLLPGLVDYRTWWVGVGVIAGELMALVTASFWARKRIGAKVWRRLHWLSYSAFGRATAHGLMAGSDSDRPWVVAIYAIALGAVALGTAWRGLQAAGHRTRPQRARITTADRAQMVDR